VNSNEWHLDTSVAAGGRSKVLQLVVPRSSCTESRLTSPWVSTACPRITDLDPSKFVILHACIKYP
ncbi:GPI transamidase component PIG-S-like, partial [Trifolium medium]|nr:GPI transamidase component PIG-S-like [Trifolium medium]